MKIKEYDASSCSADRIYREYNVSDGSLKVKKCTSIMNEKNKSTSQAYHKSGFVIHHKVKRVLSDLFLPIGYPTSVNQGYIQYQFYDSIQGLCSYLRGVVCTSAVLTAAGVGDAEAVATSAAVQWAMKDGCGMIGGLLFSYYSSVYFDSHVKEFRLFADVMNDIGLLLDMATPIICKNQKYLLYVSIAATLCRVMCGMSAGATKNSITMHFAKNNVADLSAKEGTQETLVSLIGMVLGIALARFLQDLENAEDLIQVHGYSDSEADPISIMASYFYRNNATIATWFVFLLLTWIHVWANYVGVKILRLRTLNHERCKVALTRIVDQAVEIIEREQKNCLDKDELENALTLNISESDKINEGNVANNLIDMTVSDDSNQNLKNGNEDEEEIDEVPAPCKETTDTLPKVANVSTDEDPDSNYGGCCESLSGQCVRFFAKEADPISNEVKIASAPVNETTASDEKTVLSYEDLIKPTQCCDSLLDQGTKIMLDPTKGRDVSKNDDSPAIAPQPQIDEKSITDKTQPCHGAHSMVKGEVLPAENSRDEQTVMIVDTISDGNSSQVGTQNLSIISIEAEKSFVTQAGEVLEQVDSVEELKEVPTAEDLLTPTNFCENIIDQAAKIFDIAPKCDKVESGGDNCDDKSEENSLLGTDAIEKVDVEVLEKGDDPNAVLNEAAEPLIEQTQSMAKGEMSNEGYICVDSNNQDEDSEESNLDERDECDDLNGNNVSLRNGVNDDVEVSVKDRSEKEIVETKMVDQDKNVSAKVTNTMAEKVAEDGNRTSSSEEDNNDKDLTDVCTKLPAACGVSIPNWDARDFQGGGSHFSIAACNLIDSTESVDEKDDKVNESSEKKVAFEMRKSDILQPSECNESLLKSFMGVLLQGNTVLGASLSATFRGMNNEGIHDLLEIFKDDRYVLSIGSSFGRSNVVHVSFQVEATEDDVLKSFLHALIIHRHLELNTTKAPLRMDLISLSKKYVDAFCSGQDNSLLEVMEKRGWNRSLHFDDIGNFRFQV